MDGAIFHTLGITVGSITAEFTAGQLRNAYRCQVTYVSVNEVGFDVLRDQLVTDVADLVAPDPMLPSLMKLTQFSLMKPSSRLSLQEPHIEKHHD